MNKRIDMTSGPIFSRIVAFTVPLIFTGFLQIFFNMADQAVVGHFAGRDALSSVGATSSLIHLFVNSFIGLSAGAQVCISHSLGAGDYDRARRHAHNAIATSVIVGTLVAIAGIIFARHILTLMKTPAEGGVLDGAVLYMQIYLGGAPIYMLYNYGAAIIKTQGDTKSPFLYLLCGGVLNVILNLIFVIVFGMKAEGVAIATVAANAVSAFLVVRHLIFVDSPCRIEPKYIRPYRNEFSQIMKKGIPIGLQSATFSFSNLFIQSSINFLGSAAMAGNTAAVSISGFTDVFSDSIGQSTFAFVGQNVGARKYERVKRVILTATIAGIIVSAILGPLVYFFADPLLQLFIPGDYESIGYAKIRFFYQLLFMPLATLMQVLSGSMRAIGKTLPPMLICVFGVCAFRLLWISFVFPLYPSAACIYMSFPISWAFTDVGLLILLTVFMRSLKRNFFNKVIE
ncbi:MAG: MATE family efflux transporter [Clostridia bacterium]|nr:MATE family efflux transporter [Clostridia bacterium]